jgi:hypothetical protein
MSSSAVLSSNCVVAEAKKRFDAFEINPVLEQDVDGMGGRMVCEAFDSIEEAKTALREAEDNAAIDARILWTLYGHIEGEGVEAIADFPSEDMAFDLLYKLTGVEGVSGKTSYPLSPNPPLLGLSEKATPQSHHGVTSD